MRMRIIDASKRQTGWMTASITLFKNLSERNAKPALQPRRLKQWEVVETRIVNKLMAIFEVAICVLTNGL